MLSIRQDSDEEDQPNMKQFSSFTVTEGGDRRTTSSHISTSYENALSADDNRLLNDGIPPPTIPNLDLPERSPVLARDSVPSEVTPAVSQRGVYSRNSDRNLRITTTRDGKDSFSDASRFREGRVPLTTHRPMSPRTTFSGIRTQPAHAGKSLPSLTAGIAMNSFLDDDTDFPYVRKPPSKFWGREPLPGESDVGQELGDKAPIWEKYRESAKEHDKTMTAGWNQAMDVLLVFAALFSAILTAFIIEFYRQLQPDTSGQSLDLLVNIATSLQCLTNGTICTNLPVLPLTQSQSPTHFRWINGLWFTSLMLSLSVSAIAILVKQWIHAYNSGLTGLPKTYAYIRQFRFNGVKKWHMSGIIAALPTAMYVAVLLFFAGLLVLLWSLDTIIYNTCVAVLVVTGAVYITSTILPLFDPSCPFRTPASHVLDKICQLVWFYIMHIWHLCKFGFWNILISLWGHILSWFSFSRALQARFYHQDDYIRTQGSLRNKLHLISQGEKEQIQIHSEASKLNAYALFWLSNTYVQDTRELVTQAIAGLDCNIVTKPLLEAFNGLHWPAQFLVETFNNPNPSNPSYHDKLSSYAQAYLIMTQINSSGFDKSLNMSEIQILSGTLQWYSVLTSMENQSGTPKIPVEYLRQGISELGQSLKIITRQRFTDELCFQIIIHLLLHSTLTVYVLYSENSTVQGQILENCLETLQIWMIEQNILKQHPRPCFLRSLCTVLQIFTGVIQPSALRSIWAKDRQEERTWVLLLKGLVSPSHQNELLKEEEFRQWKILQNALIECHRLLSEDRKTLESVLAVFINASPSKKELWSAEDGEQGYPFLCLDVISHLLTPQDILAIIQSFQRSWSKDNAISICTFLQKQARTLSYAQIFLTPDILQPVLDNMLTYRSFSALWVICTILETLTRFPTSASNLNMVKQRNLLGFVNDMLSHEIKEQKYESWYYSEWTALYSLATGCSILYQSYKDYVLSSGILVTLYHLLTFLSTSEFAYTKETQTFMLLILDLTEDGTFESKLQIKA